MQCGSRADINAASWGALRCTSSAGSRGDGVTVVFPVIRQATVGFRAGHIGRSPKESGMVGWEEKHPRAFLNHLGAGEIHVHLQTSSQPDPAEEAPRAPPTPEDPAARTNQPGKPCLARNARRTPRPLLLFSSASAGFSSLIGLSLLAPLYGAREGRGGPVRVRSLKARLYFRSCDGSRKCTCGGGGGSSVLNPSRTVW